MVNIFTKGAVALRGAGRTLMGLRPLPLPTPFREQGSSGTAVWGGYIQQKDTSPHWHGRTRWRFVSELAVNTSVVAAGVHYFLNLIANPKWIAQPANDSPEAKEMAAFVDDVLGSTDTPWNNIVKQAGMYRFHGFAIQEWIACRREKDGRIGFKDIEVRPQQTIEQWAVDEWGSVLGCFQRNPQTSQLLGLPRSKLIYIKEDTMTDSPEGLGVFRHLAEPYHRLKRFMELEARAYERDLRGIPIGRAPLSYINQLVKANQLTEAQGQQAVQVITDIIQMQVKQSDTGILLDSANYTSTTTGGPQVSPEKMWDFSLVNGPALGLLEISAAIDRVQREMARVMGVEHLMMGDQGGNRAVAQDKSRNVYLIASSVLRLIVATVQKDLLGPLWALNGFDPALMPKLVAEDIAPRDVVEVTTALARLSQAGAVLAPDDPVINDMRDMLGVSRVIPLQPEEPLISDPLIGGPNALPRVLPKVDDPTLNLDPNDPAGTGERLADGAPAHSAEFQRLPRTTALGADPVT